MDKLAGGMAFPDLDQELSRADAESVSSDNTVASGSNGNVQVVVRVRPPSSRERDQGYVKCVGVDSTAHSATLNFRPQPRTFTFDYVADEGVGQEEIFTSVGKPITDACLQGYHCCLIAYGQTGAGKTFTMEGPDSESSSGGSPGFLGKTNVKRHEKRGLIPRILDYIFQKMATEKTQNCKDVEFVVKCSYLQIYNEQVSDLLDPGSYNLTIHEDAKAGMYVEGLQEVVVPTSEATYGVFRRGSENRHVGMTAMNLESSRSHGVFTVVVESQRRNDGGVMNRRTSRFYLVDLAGSERQKHSESAGIRLKEAGSINKSLSALGNVIKALVDISEGKIRHVPYRDSKLTFLLKDALGGNSKCTLIANISPAEKNIDETLSTLKFAQRAKLIHNTAIVNEDMFGNPAVMGEEIRRLRLEIAALRANVGSGSGGDQSPLAGQEIQSESVRTVRLEHIISQSVKRSLEAERKNEMEMHVLELKLEATQAMCERLEKTLQSQKMIIRLRENTIKRIDSGRTNLQPEEIVSDMREEMEQLRKQIEHHPDVVRFKMELDLCRGQLDEYEEERKDEELLSQIAQLENLNQALKLEFQEMVDEKSKALKEMDEAKSSRDSGMDQLSKFEEQCVLLREAAEKYRIEAAENYHKLEKAEEKLQEKDEVLRRADLADAQATEYAQELTALKSQFEKVKVAFNQQTKLQEDTFMELQKTTDELENSRHSVTQLKSELEEAIARTAQIDAKLTQAEVDKSRASTSLEELGKECERLASSVKEKDGTISALSDDLEQVKLYCKELDDRLSAASLSKSEAEKHRDEALRRQEELSTALSTQLAEKDKALEEERKRSSEYMDTLQHETHKQVELLSSTLQERQARLEELEKLLSEQVDVLQEREHSRSAAEAEALNLHRQLEQLNAAIVSTRAEKDVLAEEVSTKHDMLEEASRKLMTCGAQNGKIEIALQVSENNLVLCNTKLSSLETERDDLNVDNRALRAELSKKLEELEVLTDRVATLDSSIAKENGKLASAEERITELTKTIDKLRADVAVTESLTSDLVAKTNEIELLKKRAVLNQQVGLADFPNCSSNHSHSGVVKPGEDAKHSLVNAADLDTFVATKEGDRNGEEENGDSMQKSMVAFQKEPQDSEAHGGVLKKDLPLTDDKVEKSKSLDLEGLRSKVRMQAQEIRELEEKLMARSRQIDVAEKAQRTLKSNDREPVLNSRSLQDKKESAMDNTTSMKATEKALEGSDETLGQKKLAQEFTTGPLTEISAARVNGIDTPEGDLNDTTRVVRDETCIDDDEGEGSHGQGTDARHEAALADIVNIKGHVAGLKVDLALSPHVHTHKQSLVALSKASHLKVEGVHVVNKYHKLIEGFGSESARTSPSVSKSDSCNREAAGWAKCEALKPHADVRSNSKTDLTSDGDIFYREGSEWRVTPSLAKANSSLIEILPLVTQVRAKGREGGELENFGEALDRSVEEARMKRRMVHDHMGLLSEVTNTLGQADKMSVEHHEVVQLEERRVELEAEIKAIGAGKDNFEDHFEKTRQLQADAQEYEHLNEDLRRSLKVLQAENTMLVEALRVREAQQGEMSKELEILTEKIVGSEDTIAELQSQSLNMDQTLNYSSSSRIAELDHILKNAVSSHDPGLRTTLSHSPVKEREPTDGNGHRVEIVVNLQELRDEVDEVQYRVGEMEYELQKHVIDTAARMVDLEKQKEVISLEATQLIARSSSENAKVASMLGTLEKQIVDHHGRARVWVQNLNSLESELVHLQNDANRMQGVESRAKQLEEDLQAEQKAGSEQREEVARLRARLLAAEQARRINPFSWNNSFGNSKSDTRSVHGVRSFTGVDPILKDDSSSRLGGPQQQRKRTATLAKDRPGGKPKTTYTTQKGPVSERTMSESLPVGRGSLQHTSRASSRLRASQNEKAKKLAITARMGAPSRQPLGPLSSNNPDEIPRGLVEPRYNLRKREKMHQEKSALTPEPPRSFKRRRLV